MYATRLSAGGVADEWVTQMLRQSDAQVFKKYSQMKLQDEVRSSGKGQPSSQRDGSTAADTMMAAPMCTVRNASRKWKDRKELSSLQSSDLASNNSTGNFNH